MEGKWRDEGHKWIGRRIARLFGQRIVLGTVVRWLPEGEDPEEDYALWHVQHDDGDGEDLVVSGVRCEVCGLLMCGVYVSLGRGAGGSHPL